MERLRAELSHLLGEPLSRLECINEKADSTLWSLYDSAGHALPLLAKSFKTPGMAARLAWKVSLLSRHCGVRMPVVYGVLTHEETPGPDVLLIERLNGVSVEAPARTPERWVSLQDQIVECMLAWHRIDSHGCSGSVGKTQELLWPHWYRNYIERLWETLNQYPKNGLTMQDKRILFRSRESLPALFEGFNDNGVLLHGNLTLRSMLKDARSDQLLALISPGAMLWGPREYELFRLYEPGAAEDLLWRYLQRAPVAESFMARRWLYLLWDEIDNLTRYGKMNRPAFDLACRSLLPWIG